MDLFMDLDKNNDGFLDRKDLLKYYGLLKQIKGAKFPKLSDSSNTSTIAIES
jgi:hypothetical protein